MKFKSQNRELTLEAFRSSLEDLPKSNRWIKLGDTLPWEKIEKRLRAAAMGDFAMAIYNPSSHRRKDYLQRACDILLETIEGERPCGYVENIGREGTRAVTCTLRELRDREVNMFTTVFIGNSETEILGDKLITRRGYQAEKGEKAE